jgi:hypothetical protein
MESVHKLCIDTNCVFDCGVEFSLLVFGACILAFVCLAAHINSH